MLWYNNPEAVTTLHHEAMRERHADVRRRKLMKLVATGSPVERH